MYEDTLFRPPLLSPISRPSPPLETNVIVSETKAIVEDLRQTLDGIKSKIQFKAMGMDKVLSISYSFAS